MKVLHAEKSCVRNRWWKGKILGCDLLAYLLAKPKLFRLILQVRSMM